MSDGGGDPNGTVDRSSPHDESGEEVDRSSTSENGLLVTERETEEGLLVSVCDGELLGETFEEGTFSLTVTEEFYGGDEVDETTVVDSLSRATVANIVGTRAVGLAVEAGVIEEANVLDIGTTRHAQLLRMY